MPGLEPTDFRFVSQPWLNRVKSSQIASLLDVHSFGFSAVMLISIPLRWASHGSGCLQKRETCDNSSIEENVAKVFQQKLCRKFLNYKLFLQ